MTPHLVTANMELVSDPAAGSPVQEIELLKRYAKHFMPVLLCNRGDPGIVARKVGGYGDA